MIDCEVHGEQMAVAGDLDDVRPGDELPIVCEACYRDAHPPKKAFTCSRCGAGMDEPERVDTSVLHSVFTTTVYGYQKPCPTPKCGEVCRICRRDPGDVHGPDCGPLMFHKIERPHIVTKEDCR